MNGSLMSGDEFATSGRYGEFTTNSSGEYTGWFCVVPTGNAVYAESNACYFYVQLNDGNGGTSISQAFRTTSTVKCLSPGQQGNNDKCTPFKIFTNAPAESIIATWADTTNTSGTYRPSYCNFVESNGISEGWNATSWYAASPSVDGTSGATMVLRNNNPGNAEGGEGIQSIVVFSTATGNQIGCPLINSSMIYSDGNNGTQSTAANGNGNYKSATPEEIYPNSLGANPSISIAASPSGTICSGTSVTFTATPTNGGTTPSYQWKLNGNNVGSNSTTYTNSSLANNDVVSCVITASADGCPFTNGISSNSVTMTVNTTPSVPSAISGSATVCSGTAQTYSVTNVNGVTYSWTLPGTWSGSSSTNSINATVGTSGGTISVTASQNGCTSASSTLGVTVNTTPTVTVSSLPDTLCKWAGNVTLSGGSPVGGTFSGTGVSGNTLQPSQVNVGVSSITYTYSANGCSASANESYYNKAGFIIPSGYDNTLPFDPCFQTQIISGSNNWTYTTSNLNGVLAPASDGIFKFTNTNAGDKARLVLPTIDFTGMNNPTMTLSWSRSNVSPSILDSVRILGSNDGGNTWSWLRSMGRASATNPNQAWQANVIPLYQYGNSSNIMIALEASSAGSGQEMGIDRIQFADSDCPQITGIGLSGNQNTATLSWNMVNNSTYTVRYGLRPDGPFTQTINNATSPITISSLILDTTYFFQVRQICQSPAVVVAWPTTYFTYYTGSNVASCQKPNGLYNSQGNSSTSRVLNWANTTTADSFQVQIWKDSLNNGNYTLVRAFFVNGANYTHTINNLSLSTNYRWRVRSRCGLNGVSVYSGWNYFTTPSSRLTAPQSNGFESMIALYPNPAHASVTLKIETEESGSNQLMLVDLNGKVVYSKSIEVSEGENEFSIGLDGFSAGIYQVIIKSETSVNYRKLIVQ